MHRIHHWIELINRKQQQIHIEKVCYSCIRTGIQKEKTVIALPMALPQMGFITLEKSMEEVELTDIIQLYSKINSNHHWEEGDDDAWPVQRAVPPRKEYEASK